MAESPDSSVSALPPPPSASRCRSTRSSTRATRCGGTRCARSPCGPPRQRRDPPAAARATRLAAATIEWVDFGQALRHVPPSQLRGLDVRRGRNALDEERSEVSWASVGGCAARGSERSRAITSVPRGPRQGTNTSLRGSARSSNCRWCRSQSYNRRDAARCRRPRLPRARKPCDGLASGPSEPCLACG